MGGREGEGGEGGREGGRESNRCVNAFLLECTVYHKTHTHNLVSSVDNFRFFLQVLCMIMAGYLYVLCTCTLVHESFLAYVFTCRTYVVLSVSSDVHTHTHSLAHTHHTHTRRQRPLSNSTNKSS